MVHLALDLDLETDAAARTAYNVRGTQTVLTAAAAAGVHRVVLCTSAMVYGALPDNELPLSEDAELRATAEATGVGDLLEIERLARRAPRAHPGLNVTVVRPAVLVGRHGHRADPVLRVAPAAGRRRVPARLAVLPRRGPGAARWSTPRWRRSTGELAVGCDGWLEQEEVEELSGIRRMELPSAVALGAAARLHRIGLTPSPAGDLAYTMYPWVVSGSRLHDAGLAAAVDQRGGARGAPGGGRRPAHGRRAAGWAARTPRPRVPRARRSPCWARRPWCGGPARPGGGSERTPGAAAAARTGRARRPDGCL